MRARTTTPTIFGAILLLGLAHSVSAQVRALPADTLPTASTNPGRRSVWVALTEVTAVNALIWSYDYTFRRKPVFEISPRTFANNLGRTPEWDTNTLLMNQLMHPYNGAMYYNVARSEGFGPLASSLFTLVGCAEWEWWWETVTPSANDIVNTTVGGITLGETFGRLSADLRRNRSGGLLGFGQGLLAGILDPGGTMNRGLLGGVTNPDFLRPSTRARLQLGASTGPASDARAAGQTVPSGGTRARMRLDLEHGDRFAAAKPAFFDAFELGLQLSSGSDLFSIDELRARGSLVGGPREREGRSWQATSLDLEFELTRNAAYAVAGQSVNLSYHHRLAAGRGWELRTIVDGRLMPVTAVSSEGALPELERKGISSEPDGTIVRTYDYGLGAGLRLASGLRHGGREVLQAGWETSWVHTFSGADGTHRLQTLDLRGTLPITARWSVTASWELHRRDSGFERLPDVDRTSHALSLGMSFGAL